MLQNRHARKAVVDECDRQIYEDDGEERFRLNLSAVVRASGEPLLQGFAVEPLPLVTAPLPLVDEGIALGVRRGLKRRATA